MKIKVKDLLVKIANGEEEISVKTKYNSATWIKNDFLFNIYKEFEKRRNFEIVEFLNDYVEIIEEPKKIGKLETYKEKEGEDYFANILKLSPNSECEIDEALSTTIDKLNELIDEINNLKEK